MTFGHGPQTAALVALSLFSGCDTGESDDTKSAASVKPRGKQVPAAVQKALPTRVGFLADNLCPGLADSVRTQAERIEARRVQREDARKLNQLVRQLDIAPNEVVKVTFTPSDEPGVIVEYMTVRDLAQYHLSLFGITREEARTPSGECALRYRHQLRAALRK